MKDYTWSSKQLKKPPFRRLAKFGTGDSACRWSAAAGDYRTGRCRWRNRSRSHTWNTTEDGPLVRGLSLNLVLAAKQNTLWWYPRWLDGNNSHLQRKSLHCNAAMLQRCNVNRHLIILIAAQGPALQCRNV